MATKIKVKNTADGQEVIEPIRRGWSDLFVPRWETYKISGEVIRYVGRRHLVQLIQDSWEAVVAAIVAVTLLVQAGERGAPDIVAILLGLVAIGALFYAGFQWLEWSITRIFVTNKRLVILGGIIRVQQRNLPNSKLTDLAYDQTVPGRILGYGHIRVESAGQNQALESIRYVRQPQFFLTSLGSVAIK